MIAALVLAAGAARRFGEQKLLAPVEGKPLVRWTVEQVVEAGVANTVVVLGREADAVRAALRGLPVEFVVNPAFQQGMSTSLRAGVEALAPAVRAALVVLGDQPVAASILKRLLRAGEASGLPIVAPSYRGERGNPVLFARSEFESLRRLEGDRGARGLLERNPGKLLLVPFAHPPPPDFDTREELAVRGAELARWMRRPPVSEPRDPSSQESQ